MTPSLISLIVTCKGRRAAHSLLPNLRTLLPFRIGRVICLLFVLYLVILGGGVAYAQGDFEKGFIPYQTYHVSDFDSVNLSNTNPLIHIPLLSYPQLGKVPPLEISIRANGRVGTRLTPPLVSLSPGLHIKTVKFKTNLGTNPPQIVCTVDTIAVDDSGSSHYLGENSTTSVTGNNCQPVNGPVESIDGSGIGTPLTDRQGNRYPADGITLIKDPNGNAITLNLGPAPPFCAPTVSTDEWIDTIGRHFHLPVAPSLAAGVCVGGPSPGCLTINYPGQNGGTIPVIFCYAQFTVNSATLVLLQSVTLPNGNIWSFTYDSSGDISSITLPTGATVSYSYTQRNTCDNFAAVGVATRTIDVHDGTALKVWKYNLNGLVNTVTDPDGNDTVHTFTSIGGAICSPFETKTQFYQGSSISGGTLLRTVETQYSDSGQAPFDGTTMIHYGIFPILRKTELPNGQISQETYQYDAAGTSAIGPPSQPVFPVSYGLLLQKNEFDYGNGGPGPLMRQTVYQYQWQGNSSYQTANLLETPCVVTVYGPGSVPQPVGCAPPAVQANQLSQTITRYDENNGSPQGVFGNATSVTHWLNGGISPTSHIVYNSQGMAAQKIDPVGNPTTFTYDPTGLFPSQIQGPDTSGVHHIDKFTYDANTGQLMSHTDQNAQITSFGYDNMRRLTGVSYPAGGGSESYAYNDSTPSPSFTFTKAITSSLNFVEKGIADGLGRPVTTQTTVPTSTCSSGIVTVSTTYDNLGRKATVSNPYCTTSDPTYGVTTTYYDALSRPVQIAGSDGTLLPTGTPVTQCQANNSCTDYSQFPALTVTDQAGKQRRSRTDGLGQLVEMDEPGPSGLASPYVTLYTYDGLGNLTCVEQHGDAATGTGCTASPSSDASSPWRIRRFSYNTLSQLLVSSNPEPNTALTGTPPAPTRVNTTYTYDANGNLLQKTSPAPNQTGLSTQTLSYCFDALNRVTGKAYSAQTCTNGQLPAGTAVVTYSYDAGTNGIGHLTSLTDQAGSGAFSYDVLGRIASEQRVINGANKGMSYEYNLDSSLFKLHYPSGAIITYAPDSAGRTISAIDSGNGINYATVGTYGPVGITSFISGSSGSFSGITNSVSYNKRLQPIFMSAAASTQTVFSLGYDFHLGAGDNGNVYTLTNNKDATRNQTFTYDQLNRLISAQNAGTDCTINLPDTNSKFWGNSYGYDAWGNLLTKNITKCASEFLSVAAQPNNQLVGFGYDAAGNMVSSPAPNQATSVFDAENRMTASNFGGAMATYSYDADGNRVEKSDGTTGTLYWYMMPGVVAESDLGGNLQSEYVFFNGERVARKDFPSNSVSYYFSDHLKTTDIVTDAQGNILNESDYYPWGGELRFVANDSNHYKFTGKERDDNETGLDYFGARYYSNQLGRWVTPDWSAVPVPVPYADLSDPQSLNQYAYVRDLPTTKIDINGHGDDDGILSKWFKALIAPLMDSNKGTSPALDNTPRDPVTNVSTHEMVQYTTDTVGNGMDKMAAVLTAFDPTGQSAALRSYLKGDNLGLALAMAGPFVGLAGGELAGVAEAFGFRSGSYAVTGDIVGGQLNNGASLLANFSKAGSELGVKVSVVGGNVKGTLGAVEQGAVNAAKGQGLSSVKLTATMVSKSMARWLRKEGYTQVMKDGKATGEWTKTFRVHN